MLVPGLNYAFETYVEYQVDIFFAIGANASSRVDNAFETYVEYQVDMFFAIGANASSRVELFLWDICWISSWHR